MPDANTRFLDDFSKALDDGAGGLFVGAGVSMAAGYPSWSSLLKEIGEELGVGSSNVYDLAALAQWSIQESGGATRVRNVIKAQIAREHPIPEVLGTISRLPVRHIWTTNYDRLVERAFAAIGRPIDVISGANDLSLRATPGAARLYKMHGSVDRLDNIVVSTDDYELYRTRRGAYLPLLQAHLTSMSMLFIGLSFTDPNVRHVLSLIRESFTEAPPEHFAVVRPPKSDQFASNEEFLARLKQHNLWARDLRRYGLHAVEIDEYGDLPLLLKRLERRVASRRIWLSGSWPFSGGAQSQSLYTLAERIGRWAGDAGYSLVSGVGQLVGSASIAGFLEALRTAKGWDLDRRLIVRPFPQPVAGSEPDRSQWTALRSELARQAGVVIFLGGARVDGNSLVVSTGVMEEFALARDAGTFLLPVGATGGAAHEISKQLQGSALVTTGPDAMRPTDEELESLSDSSLDHEALLVRVANILDRLKDT